MTIIRKFSLTILSFSLISSIFLVFISVTTLKHIAERQIFEVYTERIRIVMFELQQTYDKLTQTGIPELYENVYQKDIIQSLRKKYYANTDQTYLFIINKDRELILHPYISQNSPDFELAKNSYISGHIVTHENGNFQYTWKGTHKWCVFRKFIPWNWYAVFTVDDSIRYQVLIEFFIKFTAFVLFSSLGLIALIIYMVKKQILVPMKRIQKEFDNIAKGHKSKILNDYLNQKNEMSIFVNHFQKMSEQIRYQQQFEETILNVSRALSKLLNINDATKKALQIIGEFAHADRAYAVMVNEDGMILDESYEWCLKGISPFLQYIKKKHLSRAFPWFWASLQKGQDIIVPSVDTVVKDDIKEKRYFFSQDTKSFVIVPIMGSQAIIGFIGLDIVTQNKSWPEDIIDILHTTSEIMSGVWRNYKYTLEIKRKNENKRILLNNIPVQIWFLTDKDTYGAVNKVHAEFNGVGINDLSFKNIHDIFSKDIAESWHSDNDDVFKNSKQIVVEKWIPNYSGNKRLMSIIKTPKLDFKGNVEYIVCAAEDITERKQSEEQNQKLLNESNRLIRLMTGREQRVLEIKKEVNELRKQLGKEPKYRSII